MRILLVIVVLICIMFNSLFLFAQQESKRANKRTLISKDANVARQEAEAVNKELDAELQDSNTEVEQIRLDTQEQTSKDMQQAEKDLERSIQGFQELKFPEEIEEEITPEEK